MHDEHSSGDPAAPEPGSHIEKIEASLLLKLLDPPFGDHVRDLALDFNESEPNIEAAVGDLIASGLASRTGVFVSPSRAAIRFNQLWPLAI